MTPIKVFAVDDSSVVRRFLAEAIGDDPELEVVGLAANGRIALDRLEAADPDVVVLDIEMPELDGLQTLAELKRRRPHLPVIMFSTYTERGATATLDALALGASDYLHKPGSVGMGRTDDEETRAALVRKVKVLAYRPLQGRPPSSGRVVPPVEPTRIDAVAIGVSTGGPFALAEVFKALPEALPVPVFIVQHMPAIFTSRLAERLDTLGPMRVHEAVEGTVAEAGHAYVAPGDFHLSVVGEPHRATLHLDQSEAENSCRPSADVLFRSVAKVYGARSLGVVLTGMGRDGLRGSEAMRQSGAAVLAQDEATSVVWGMPGAVVRARIASDVLPLEGVAGAVALRCAHGRARLSRP